MLLPIIMAGGAGSRLWPLSRQLHPKQFLALAGEQTLLQDTISRLDGLEHEQPWLICNEQHRFLAAEQMRQLGIESSRIFLEPEGRNTAPAIAIAALQALADRDDALLLVLAADHVIQDKKTFHAAIANALTLAEAGHLVTFGVTPASAETGYGYIQRGKALGDCGFMIDSFAEKPDEKTAQSYVDSNEYFWNSGMFLFRASRYIEELRRFNPDMVEICQAALQQSQKDADFIRVAKDIFMTCPEDSIDYAVMEKTDCAAVVPLNAGWSDVGSWSALWDISEKNRDGNVLQGDAVAEGISNTLVRAEHRLVAAVGVENLIIVETKDAVLVVHKDKVQDVKKVVERIKKDGRHEHISHREVYRPWGVYDSIDDGPRYQVKRITVKPGAKLSVQMHYHRAEHWEVDLYGNSSNNLKACDFTITSPTFTSSYCNGQTQLGLYTVRNNTPVSVLLQRIEIVQNDTLLPGQTAILASPVNNCVVGASLAPGATCNVLVNVSALAVSGTFNRVLRVYMNTRQVKVDSSPITSTVTGLICPMGTSTIVPPVPPLPVVPPTVPVPPAPAPIPPLCPLYQFAVLGASTVTNIGPTIINGDLGVSPGTAVTGFPPGVINGTTYLGAGSLAGTAQAQALTRYNELAGETCNVNLTGQNLGGMVLAPGVYCFSSSAQLTGTLTLNGLGDPNATFIFQIGSTLTTASNSAVVLMGSAENNNVDWQVGSAATLGSDTAFQGNIYAQTSITMNTAATLQGRAIALTGAVTLDSNAVNRTAVCP